MLLSGLGEVFTAALRDIKRRCASSSLNFSFLVVAMVKTPYGYEGLLSDQDFSKNWPVRLSLGIHRTHNKQLPSRDPRNGAGGRHRYDFSSHAGGVVLSHGSDERIYFNLRSKNRSVNRNDLLSATRSGAHLRIAK